MNRPRSWDNHPPCPGGCGQLADECECRNPNPLGAMRVEPAIGSNRQWPPPQETKSHPDKNGTP